jgi:hypothetical protein
LLAVAVGEGIQRKGAENAKAQGGGTNFRPLPFRVVRVVRGWKSVSLSDVLEKQTKGI